MATVTIYDYNSFSKTILFDNNKLEIGTKSIFGKEPVFYNGIAVPVTGFFGRATCVFIAVENNRYVQYDVSIRLRWHCLGYYTTVTRQGRLLFSDK